jgi:hypothetical protein
MLSPVLENKAMKSAFIISVYLLPANAIKQMKCLQIEKEK